MGWQGKRREWGRDFGARWEKRGVDVKAGT